MKKVVYVIFFNSQGEAVQVPIPRSKTFTGILYRRVATKKFENYVKKSRPRLCLQSLTLLQDNVPAHSSKGTLPFLEKMLDNPPAPTLSSLFSPMIPFLASTSEKNSRGSDISLKTCCWGSSVSVSKGCT